MDGAAIVVAVEPAHVDGLGHDALSCDGCVSVDDHGQCILVLEVAEVVLLAPYLPLHDGSDELQVAGVEGQSEVHAAAVGIGHVTRETQVVLHVARAHVLGTFERVFEFLEDVSMGLSKDIGQHVESSPVGHADDGLFDSELAGRVEQNVEQRNDGLGPFHREPLRADVLRVHELLEVVGSCQLVQNAKRGWTVQFDAAGALLDAPFEPSSAALPSDVHELGTDGPTVGLLTLSDDVSELCLVGPSEPSSVKDGIEVAFRESVVGEGQLRQVPAFSQPQGVERGNQVAAASVG